MKLKVLIFLQIILYGLFIYVSNALHWTSDIVAVLICYICGYTCFRASEANPEYKLLWLLASVMAILYGGLESVWTLLYFFSNINPESSLLLEVLYYIPYFIMLFSVLNYLIKKRFQFNKARMLVEIAFMTLIVFVLWNGAFLSKLHLMDYNSTIQLLVFLTLITDSILLIAVLVLGSSVRSIKEFMAFPIIVFPYLVYTITDGFYLFEYITGSYYKNNLSDLMYILSYTLLTLVAGLSIIYKEKAELHRIDEKKREIRMLAILWLLPLPAVFYLSGMMDVNHFIMILSIIITYEFYQYFAQQGDVSKLLLENERAMILELENVVKKRTSELIIANEKLRVEAITDSLTGLKNRKYFYEQVQLNIDMNLEAFSILFIDLDDFKLINDNYGHKTGDFVLLKMSNHLQHVIEESDFVARLGGDEFGIMINTADRTLLNNYIQRIDEAIKKPIKIDSYHSTVKASIGLATYPEDARELDALLRVADLAMYKEKKTSKYEKNE